MSFLKPVITVELTWWQIETVEGTFYVPFADFVQEQVEADFACIEEPDIITGHGARLSAPGYMDCTEWSVHRTEAEAAQYLIDMYYDMPDDEMTADELDEYAMLVRITKGETP